MFATMDRRSRPQPPGNSDGSVPRRRSAVVVGGTPHHQNIKSTIYACCSGGHVHGCGCDCPGCSCRSIPFKNESNRNAYNGEGGVPIPGTDRSDYSTRASSLNSNDSGLSRELENSYEAEDPLHEWLATEDIHRPNYMHDALIEHVDTAFNQDDVDEFPFRHFISPGHGTASYASSSMIFENMEGSSMRTEMGGSNSAFASNLSDYQSAWTQHSMTTSQAVACTGTSFPVNNFLPLTPECRHERTRQMCRHCFHY